VRRLFSKTLGLDTLLDTLVDTFAARDRAHYWL